MKFLNCLALLVITLLSLTSCSSGNSLQTIDDNSYRSSGVEQYFLPEVPNWANYSQSGKCFKNSSFHYLDFSRLGASYKLSYVEMIELQAQFNSKLEEYFRSSAQRFLKPVEEASFFSNTLEQVRGGIRQFKVPQVNEVEIVWLEGLVHNDDTSGIKKLAKLGRFDSKLPILFSTCHSKQSLAQWIAEHDLDQVGFYPLSAEYLSPYSSENKLEAGLRVEIKKLFNSGVKLSYLPEQLPIEIVQ
jgi:hypothetical protein